MVRCTSVCSWIKEAQKSKSSNVPTNGANLLSKEKKNAKQKRKRKVLRSRSNWHVACPVLSRQGVNRLSPPSPKVQLIAFILVTELVFPSDVGAPKMSSSWFREGKASTSPVSSELVSRLVMLIIFFHFLQSEIIVDSSRLMVETTPVVRKSPQKLKKLRVFDSATLPVFWQFWSPIHFFSIWTISAPPVMFRIAVEMSATNGEPFGKACSITRH